MAQSADFQGLPLNLTLTIVWIHGADDDAHPPCAPIAPYATTRRAVREGKIKEFTGISDPYDVPVNPELSVETKNVDVDNCAHQVILKLESMGLIKA